MKDYFKLDWAIFKLFVLFSLFAHFRLFEISSFAGNAIGSGIFNLFGFFNNFACAGSSLVGLNSIWCDIWNPLLIAVVLVLNIFWQIFLANVVMKTYHKFKNKNSPNTTSKNNL